MFGLRRRICGMLLLRDAVGKLTFIFVFLLGGWLICLGQVQGRVGFVLGEGSVFGYFWGDGGSSNGFAGACRWYRGICSEEVNVHRKTFTSL